MFHRLVAAPFVLFALIGCTSSEDDAARSLTLRATMSAGDDGLLAFLSPSATIATHEPADVVGKPCYVGVFPAGFSSGNDPALYQVWGTVPASLDVTATTPAMFEPGAYDTVIVFYVSTPVSAAQLAFEESPSAAAGGDLSSFTLSSVDVLPGDPDQALGTLRMNVIDGDVVTAIANRTPDDITDRAQTTAAFDHTILIIP